MKKLKKPKGWLQAVKTLPKPSKNHESKDSIPDSEESEMLTQPSGPMAQTCRESAANEGTLVNIRFKTASSPPHRTAIKLTDIMKRPDFVEIWLIGSASVQLKKIISAPSKPTHLVAGDF